MTELTLHEDYIRLGQALKAARLVENGGEAKRVIQEGLVRVNGTVEVQRGKKLIAGDVVSFQGNTFRISK